MADDHHHHQHRPHRLSVPSRAAAATSVAAATPRLSHPLYPSPYPPPSTPAPTPSKHRRSSLSSFAHRPSSSSRASLSFLLLLLFSLRSLYSLFPFLRSSSPSFSLFPFSFLVSLFSFLLTLAFSSFPSSPPSSKDPFFFQQQKQKQPIFSLFSITQSQRRLLLSQSLLLAVVFLLRFQALRYCGAAAMILAEFAGNVAARFVAGDGKVGIGDPSGSSKVRGFFSLFIGLLLLSISWDRVECFPLSTANVGEWGLSLLPKENCLRIWPLLLPFLSGFLGCYERFSMNSGTIRQLGSKRIRLLSLFFATIVLAVPAAISIVIFGTEHISFGNMGWPLVNTVVFGVLLCENCSDENETSSKDFQREYLVTFLCTIVLELFYFPELSLWGLLLCGLLLWIAVRESNYGSLKLSSDSSGSLPDLIMKPIRHILSERKSRKIALFLLINTGYMVVEFVAGFMSNSLGLISDACHMLFDCAALAIGLYASYISRLPGNNQFSYGRGRFEVLSGYVNAVLLVLVGALIVLESLERILDPQEISTSSLLVVSIGGLVVNMVGLVFFHEEHHHAHGGSGSCSHSHSSSNSSSHSHSHSHCGHHHHDHKQSHDHGEHAYAHEVHIEHQECSSHDCHKISRVGHENQHNDHSDSCTKDKILSQKLECHDHHGQVHQHKNLDNNHCADHHDHCDHHHHHDHHHSEHHHCGNSPCVSTSSPILSVESPATGHTLHQMPSVKKLLEEPHKHHHQHIDHNMEGIFLHVLADTMGSVGVVISTLLIKYKGWLVADPACSIFISALIISSVLPLLRNSAEILLQRVPRALEFDLKEALSDVIKIKGVCGIQNLHVWSLTNTDVVGTLHLHVSTDTEKASITAQVSRILHSAGIKDLTMQVECLQNNL